MVSACKAKQDFKKPKKNNNNKHRNFKRQQDFKIKKLYNCYFCSTEL